MWLNFGSCENNENLDKTLFSQLGHNYAVVIHLCSSCENNVLPGYSLFSQLPKKPVLKLVVKRTTFKGFSIKESILKWENDKLPSSYVN